MIVKEKDSKPSEIDRLKELLSKAKTKQKQYETPKEAPRFFKWVSQILGFRR